MRIRLTLLASLALLSTACDWRVYDELEENAQIVSLSGSADFDSNTFGLGLTTFEGSIGGVRASRIGVSGGIDSPFASFTAWDGNRLAPSSPLFEACVEACNGEGSAIAGLASFGGAEGCVFSTAPGSQRVVLRCESAVGTLFFPTPAPSLDFGASIDAVEGGGAASTALLIGDPGLGGGGGVYSIPAATDLNAVGILPVTIAGAGRAATMGARLGTSIVSTGTTSATRVALSAPGAGLVLVGSLMGPQSMMAQGCVRGGQFLAMGTDTRDGNSRLFVGTGSEIDVYLVSSVNGGCDAMGSAAMPDTTLACAGCSSLAAGDVDGDGDVDLIAGEPARNVDGENGAGAVHIFAGPDFTERTLITHSSPSAGAAFGTLVDAVMTQVAGVDRAEPVASAPGEDRVYVLTCSGFGGDSPGANFGCVPR